MLLWRRPLLRTALSSPFALAASSRRTLAASSRRTFSSSSLKATEKEIRHHDEEVSLGIKMNLNFHWIADHADEIQRNIERRNAEGNAHEVRDLYHEYVACRKLVDSIRSGRKKIAKEMSKKGMAVDVRNSFIEKAKSLKGSLADAEQKLEASHGHLLEKAMRIPNMTSEKTPDNKGKLLELINATQERDQTSGDGGKDHLLIGEASGLLDFNSASKVAGHNHACFMKSEAALLELALVNFALSYCSSKGFVPVLTPDVARRTIVERCGFAPKGKDNLDSQVYQLEGSDLCLVGTSEIPLAGMLASQLVDESELPLKFVAFSHCFRREAGGSGAGLYRMHQFSKVEMFGFTTPSESDNLLEEILSIQREIFSLLELECRVLEMPATDLGAPAYRKVDIEAWMPGRGSYGELSSASNCLDYQTRRLDIRFRPNPNSKAIEDTHTDSPEASRSGKTSYVHTVNGTGLAIPRTIIAIFEQMYDEDNACVRIPKALQSYLGGRDRIPVTVS